MLRRSLLVWMLVLVGCSSAGDQELNEGLGEKIPSAKIPTQEYQAQLTTPKLTPESQETFQLTSSGPAPELTNDVWINSPKPLRLADLHGKVILLEMWTFG
ncbi:MAG: hypothetical protein ACK2UM_03745 [Anaerolineales bacterium]|jgi:hypothetical protein